MSENSQDSQRAVYLSLDKGVQGLLADNSLAISDLFRAEGLDVKIRLASNPAAQEGSGEKELVTLILGSAAAIALVTPILTRLMNAISHRPIVVKETVCVPVETSDHEPLYDKTGRPILQWLERTKVMQRAQTRDTQDSSVNVKAFGIDVSISSSDVV